jgi:hypothetical protein
MLSTSGSEQKGRIEISPSKKSPRDRTVAMIQRKPLLKLLDITLLTGRLNGLTQRGYRGLQVISSTHGQDQSIRRSRPL